MLIIRKITKIKPLHNFCVCIQRQISRISEYSSVARSLVAINDDGDEKANSYLNEVVGKHLTIVENFVNDEEEKSLMNEVEKAFRRTKYQFDHWDGAIQGFRETEKSNWNSDNLEIFKKVKSFSFDEKTDIIPTTHVLDLAEEGHIKPHIDSIKFCGNKIAGINLLADAIMRYRLEKDAKKFIDVLLPRFSLYIMRDALRYEFTHEVLSDEESFFNGKHVKKGRRVSIIHRNEP